MWSLAIDLEAEGGREAWLVDVRYLLGPVVAWSWLYEQTPRGSPAHSHVLV